MTSETIDNAPKHSLLEVENIVKYFPLSKSLFSKVRSTVKAVDGVSFKVEKGETFGLVGESGCGKSTLSQVILRLIPATSGKVCFEGEDIFAIPAPRLRQLRKDMQIIFQDPYSSLNPSMKVKDIIGESLHFHKIAQGKEKEERVRDLLNVVGLQASYADRYPHEFSGGQRQRIGIARALALQPKLIICDEPVSALDVSIQSQVLNLLDKLQEEFKLTYTFIAHSLNVIRHVSDRVGVMYLGKLVEVAPVDDLFADPYHPYTKALISAIPVSNPNMKRQRIILEGDVPSPVNTPPGCAFHTRCPYVMKHCNVEQPPLLDLTGQRQAACHLLVN